MVNVAVLGPEFNKRKSFELTCTVGQILDEVVPNPAERSISFIVFMDKILPEDVKLCDIPKMKDAYTLNVMMKTHAAKTSVPFDSTKFRECRRMLKKLNSSRKFFEMLNVNLRDERFCTRICSKFPALKEDWAAYRIFSDVSTCNIFLKPSSECRPYFEKHPVLVEVYYYMLSDLMHCTSSAMNGLFSPNQSHRFPTPSFGMDGEQASSSSQVSGSSRQIITSDMLRQAMAGAMANVDPLPSTPRQSVGNAVNNPYVAQLAELESLGFNDVEQNMNALEATSGDVGQAIELLIVMRESLNN